LLSNIYLNGLDWKMAQNGFEMVRYADDYVVLCPSQEQAQKALEQISQWVEVNGLKLHPTKTRLVNASQRGGFDFLGYHFERGKKWPRKKSLDKLKDAIRSKTQRNSGLITAPCGLPCLVACHPFMLSMTPAWSIPSRDIVKSCVREESASLVNNS
jgi:Reverse transcriptase (RNA-dependent DNA polymerase)